MDGLHAEHGFSALVAIRREGRTHRILFDAGASPNGLIENMCRLNHSPKDIEAIVLSHGHFDHTTGLNGVVHSLGRANLPLLIHPEFWTRRRIEVPGSDPVEYPSMSKSALLGAGFEIIEERQHSFLLDGALLTTGEVDRTTDFETGFTFPARGFTLESVRLAPDCGNSLLRSSCPHTALAGVPSTLSPLRCRTHLSRTALARDMNYETSARCDLALSA